MTDSHTPEPATIQDDGLPTVRTAWSRVMEDVQAIGKHQRNDDQKYMFRGVDAVMNAVGPVLRKHRVHILPHRLLSVTYRDVRTSRDKPAREVTVQVEYEITGPAGDTMHAQVPGESMDFGDKGTAKAMSVAYRILLLQGLTIPTDEPEPDAGTYERANETGPVLPPDLYQARQAAAGAWAVHYGNPTPEAVAADFERWSGGESFWDAAAGRIRTYAAYLSNLPKEDAGSDPATQPPPSFPDEPTPEPEPLKDRTRKMLFALWGKQGVTDRQDQLTYARSVLGREVESRGDLTEDDAQQLISVLRSDGDG